MTMKGNNVDYSVVGQPKLDLDLYIQNYTGPTRFQRLLHIGTHCQSLSTEALKYAVAEAKSGSDIGKYVEVWDQVRNLAPGEPEAAQDEDWIEKTKWANKVEASRLEAELKGYKNNLIKESIRMGNEDLGKHLEKTGALNEAAEAYTRMRQEVSTTKHIIDCGMHLVGLALQRKDWTLALNHVNKISSVQHPDDEAMVINFSNVVSGVAGIGRLDYDSAARSFLKCDFNAVPATYSHIASPNDLATYGGLLSLATMDRKALQTKVLDNASFRAFLENEPHVRKAISFFVGGRYSNCLSILESFRNDYLLDVYLHKHVPAIYSRIRSKCIVQYTAPFSCVTIESLSEAFGRPNQSLEDELVHMVREKALDARVDSMNGVLITVRNDPRLDMQKKALKTVRRYEEEAKERLRRVSILSAGLEISGSKKQAPSADEGGAIFSQA